MTRIIILAAGKGTRMNSELPKVLVSLKGRPMITYLLDSIKNSQVDNRPLVVVSPENKKTIANYLKEYQLDYVVQKEQLGTGDAVISALKALNKKVDRVLVLYGDQPFLKSDSIKKITRHDPKALLMLTSKVPNFDSWYHNFYQWGRIIRDANNNIEKIIEFKDASEEEKLINEVNPGIMYFNLKWLIENSKWLDNKNNQGEYYLTDLVEIAFNEKIKIDSMAIAPAEVIGINSLEELKIAESLV